jgi:hypothetical protein
MDMEPVIKHFHERKMAAEIMELRDRENVPTFTYLVNSNADHAVTGKTALGGKLTYLGESVGFSISGTAQYGRGKEAEPNGLYSPANTGNWVLLKDPANGRTDYVYVDAAIFVSPFKLPFD